jgi:hypothetical protein
MTTTKPATRRFPLQATEWGMLVLGILLFGGGFVFFAHRTVNNEAGLIINRIIELGPRDASIVYFVLAICSALFVLGAILGLVNLARGSMEIVVTESTISLPRAVWRRSMTTIAFADITAAYLETIAGQEMLRIESRSAGKAAIVKSHLGEASWNEVCQLVLARAPKR